MVSYMYQYENGVKRRNVGFAKVEAKGGLCKITLHMQLLGQLDSIFPTYLIQRNTNNLELVYLGDAMLKNQVMDSKLTAEENNIMGTGYKLSDMGGLLLFLHDNIFFATEWDDKPVVADEVLAALRPKKNKTFATKESVNSELQWNKNIESNPVAAEAVQARTHTNPSSEIQDFGQKMTLEEEIRTPKYKLPGGFKMIERLQQPYATAAVTQDQLQEEIMKEKTYEIIKDLSKEMKRSIDLTTSDEEPPRNKFLVNREQQNFELHDNVRNVEDGINYTAASENVTYEVDSEETISTSGSAIMEDSNLTFIDENNIEDITEQEENLPDPLTAQQFFTNYPRIYPFEDNEVMLCVKIEPKDIGLLPKEVWTYSNNSFLMHGFYCYHHLIFAKMKNCYGSQFILGVPGIFHNREQFMAKMFGFENFKSMKKREIKQGDFGYWYLPIFF